MQEISPDWLRQLDAILARLTPEDAADEDASQTRINAALIAEMSHLDPDLLTYLITQVSAMETPQAVTLLEALGMAPDVAPAIAQSAQEASDALTAQGIASLPMGEEHFYRGWAQLGRETGEQIMLLSWRMASGEIEAMVFLLNWRGDGLKDYYRTRGMRDDEWRELVEHNGQKGAPLIRISRMEGAALLKAALAESQRFSRPAPREYKLDAALAQRRLLDDAVVEPTERKSTFITPDLTPQQVVTSYVAALHYRDYALAAALLAPAHSTRDGRSIEDAATQLRGQFKHAPRRETQVQVEETTQASADVEGDERADAAEERVVEARGGAIAVERSGQRRRRDIHERYTLRRSEEGWRITDITEISVG